MSTTISVTSRTCHILAWPGPSEKSVNPYTWLLYNPMQRQGVRVAEYSPYSWRVPKCDIFHVHWPEKIFWGRPSKAHPRLSGLLCQRVLAAVAEVKKRGGIVAWTAHNLEPHGELDAERRVIWEDYAACLRHQVDLVFSLSECAKALLIDTYPDLASKSIVTVPHPHYRGVYPPAIAKGEARQALQIREDAFVLCSLGGLRPNKGITEMMEAFIACARDDEYLVVAGRCNDPAYFQRLLHLAEASSRIKIINAFVSDEELSRIMSAADGCLMNFLSILNSGSVMLSLSFDKPVIAPLRGSIAELARDLGRTWLLPLEQPVEPQALRKIIDELRKSKSRTPAPLDPYSPLELSIATLRAYNSALAARR